MKIKTNEKVMCIVDYESFNGIPIEPFIMQTVFESETTLQHPYEFIDANTLQYPHESKSKARVRDRIPNIFDIWCSLNYYQ